MGSQDLRCIYTNQRINAKRFSLDHYLPWSFLAHDQLWNLIPTSPEVNSAKSNNIPSKKYFESFVFMQHQGLTVSHNKLPPQKWQNQVESYLSDLGNTQENLLNLACLSESYKRTIMPLTSLAAAQGFRIEWSFD